MMVLAALGLGVLSGARAAGIGDASVLVQAAVQAHAGQGGQAAHGLSRQQLAQSLADGQMPALPAEAFDCAKYPLLCMEPFNCHTFTRQEMMSWFSQGMASGGRANIRTWCFSPQYQNYVHTCLVRHDLELAAQGQYNWSVDQHKGVEELDGSYCFIEGHCTNTAVTKETTLAEADAMCDERFGHNAWTKFGTGNVMVSHAARMQNPKALSKETGFHDPRLTRVFLMAACAMGNYHCDVVYCKETYCKKPYYVEKYGHLLPKAPGHLLQQREWLD